MCLCYRVRVEYWGVSVCSSLADIHVDCVFKRGL